LKPFKNLLKRKNKEDEYIYSVLKQEDVIISPDTHRDIRIPPGQREIEKWPVLHAGKVPKIDLSTWKFRIWGLVGKEKEYTLKEFQSIMKIKVFSDIHCDLLVKAEQSMGRYQHFPIKRRSRDTS